MLDFSLCDFPSIIHLGFAVYMITSFMLAYNGIMSVLLLQASRTPDGNFLSITLFFLLNENTNSGKVF